ncbi:hypothetical protein [Actinomadura opuntiae]|uniref:hypothetical protein n=1 Tax=Actinomadura sp. OS1-43 TaxID=604315 RepID=UPI00255ADFFE|nr:hypothetical protein [Actinomadura sp. OS1-43]MDL4815463.1 hypothetical protein [Actinomadura sp. OS1-43]
MAKRTTTTTAHCRRCRALLTNPARVAAGIGTRCERIERREDAERQALATATAAADVSAFKDGARVLDKAEQLILDGAIIPLRHEGAYLANGSDGVSTYYVDTVEQSCTCKAGQRLSRCNHLIAANILDHTAAILAA